jgi:hypothetical protein
MQLGHPVKVKKGEVGEFPPYDLTPLLSILRPRIELTIEEQFRTALVVSNQSFTKLAN